MQQGAFAAGLLNVTAPKRWVSGSPNWPYQRMNCVRRYRHDWVTCPFAHLGEKARRRCVRTHQYGSNACPDIQRDGRCPRGDACPMTHSVFEFWLHPNRYRTQLCHDGDKCTRKICFFAHSISTLRVPAMQHQEQQHHHSPNLSSTLRSSSSSLVTRSAGSFSSGSTSLPAVESSLRSAGLESPATHSNVLPAWQYLEQQHRVQTASAAIATNGAANSGCALLSPARQQSLPVLSGQVGNGCFWQHSSMLNSTNPVDDTWLSGHQSLAAQQLVNNGLDIAAQLRQLQLQPASADTADLTELLRQLLLQADACQADAAHSQLGSFATLTGPAGHMPGANAAQSMQQHLLMPAQCGTSAAETEVASTSAAWPGDAVLLSYASLQAQFGISSTAASNGLVRHNSHGPSYSSSASSYGPALAAGMSARMHHLL